ARLLAEQARARPPPRRPLARRAASTSRTSRTSAACSAYAASAALSRAADCASPPPIHNAINVLIVMDGRPGSDRFVSFGYADQNPANQDNFFGLGKVIDVLTDRSNPFLVPIDV